MSEDSDQNTVNRKRPAVPTGDEDGDSSDSSSEQCGAKVKVAKTVTKKQVPRVMNDVHDGIDESEDLHRKDGDNKERISDGEGKKEEQEVGTSEERENSGGSEERISDGDGKKEEQEVGTSEERENSTSSDCKASEEIKITLDEMPTLSQEPVSSGPTDNHHSITNDEQVASTSTEAVSANCMSECSDGDPEKCPICLLNFATQDIGTPEGCNHNFCLCCLQEWVKNTNVCPVDRQSFTTILVRSRLEGEVVNKIQVDVPVHPPADDLDQINCVICRGHENMDRMLYCYDCNFFYHPECINPPIGLQDRFALCPNCYEFTLHNPEDEAKCWICWTLQRQPEMIMCFECSTNYHQECLDPPVNSAPARWLCPRCNKTAVRKFPWQLPAANQQQAANLQQAANQQQAANLQQAANEQLAANQQQEP